MRSGLPPWTILGMGPTSASARAWPKGLVLAAIATAIVLLLAVLFANRADRPHQTSPTSTPSATSAVALTPATDLTGAFRVFVMRDREDQPAWLDRITQVHWADNGQLWAETTYPADWIDRNDSTHPAESICLQLSAYQILEIRNWTGVAVFAADGALLVMRADEYDPCRQ
jgi:hypothetical protein